MAILTTRPRAIFASDPTASRGRLFAEPDDARRNAFRRDCDRIIHSTAFRRLKHKTQVFIEHEGDHFRTRLTHSLEVAQIARSLARALGLDEDLAETLALAHDLGHTPFGHAGERALDACMAAFGGFDHNAQSLRILTRLEARYARFDGLNLTWESLEGLVKHNGPILDAQGHPAGAYRGRAVPPPILEYCVLQDLELATFASAEAQVAALADDIAYDVHDIDDGLRAGLFDLDALEGVELIARHVAQVRQLYPGLPRPRLVGETLRRLIAVLIDDVVVESDRRLAHLSPESAADIRAADQPVIAFSHGMAQAEQALKGFLYPRMYRHPRVVGVMEQASSIVRDLFGLFTADPTRLPPEWLAGLDTTDPHRVARRVADFIAGMTDRFARIEHGRHFDRTPPLL
jgi:dGTPase